MDLATEFDGDARRFDLTPSGDGLAADGGLFTAVVLSVFTDRRADPDDVIPSVTPLSPANAGLLAGRGWVGDTAADRWGSKRWLLSREKRTQETLNRLIEYDREALQWLIDDGLAGDVQITARFSGVALDRVEETATIIHPNGRVERVQFNFLWADLNSAEGL